YFLVLSQSAMNIPKYDAILGTVSSEGQFLIRFCSRQEDARLKYHHTRENRIDNALFCTASSTNYSIWEGSRIESNTGYT
ncbi:MAG: hypothetical protein QXU18_13045, partial [Thermoplasmatales archaeon]